MTPTNDFGKRIRGAREIRGWSALHLAGLTGIARGKIAKIENNLCRVRLDEACILAKAVGIAVQPDEQDYHMGVKHGIALGSHYLSELAKEMGDKLVP